MGRYLVRRVLHMLIVLLAISVITFFLMHAVPGGPFDREHALPPEVVQRLEEHYHLNDPLIVQYLYYLTDVLVPHVSVVAPGVSLADDALFNVPLGEDRWLKWMNFGPSLISKSRTVNDIFRDQLPISFQLGLMAMSIAVVLGFPLGVVAALKQNTLWDYSAMAVAILGVSVPVIVLGPILVWVFGVSLKVLPPTGWGAKPPFVLGVFPSNLDPNYFRYAIMPAFALGFTSSALIARLTRATLLQVVHEDYIRTARAKGLVERIVVMRHALKNSLIPVVTILGPLFAGLVTGTFATELIFGIPGIGRYFVTSVTYRDYPVIIGTVLLFAIFLVIANLVVDLLYAWLDPRIRYT